MSIKTVFNEHVAEKTSPLITCQIVDAAGAGLGPGSLASLTLTLYDRASGSIINSRSAQNVLNANQVTVDGSGNLQFSMNPADNPILDDTLDVETHVALFEWTWSAGGGTKAGKYEIYLLVKNLVKVS